MTLSKATVEALQNRYKLELMSHDDAAANAEQEIAFYRSMAYLIKRGSLRGMYDTKMVCRAQFQIRQILHICFLLLWVVFDSNFLLLFIVGFFGRACDSFSHCDLF